MKNGPIFISFCLKIVVSKNNLTSSLSLQVLKVVSGAPELNRLGCRIRQPPAAQMERSLMNSLLDCKRLFAVQLFGPCDGQKGLDGNHSSM